MPYSPHDCEHTRIRIVRPERPITAHARALEIVLAEMSITTREEE